MYSVVIIIRTTEYTEIFHRGHRESLEHSKVQGVKKGLFSRPEFNCRRGQMHDINYAEKRFEKS